MGGLIIYLRILAHGIHYLSLRKVIPQLRVKENSLCPTEPFLNVATNSHSSAQLVALYDQCQWTSAQAEFQTILHNYFYPFLVCCPTQKDLLFQDLKKKKNLVATAFSRTKWERSLSIGIIYQGQPSAKCSRNFHYILT